MSGNDAGAALAILIGSSIMLVMFLGLVVGEVIISVRKKRPGACQRCGGMTEKFRAGGNTLWRCTGYGKTYG